MLVLVHVAVWFQAWMARVLPSLASTADVRPARPRLDAPVRTGQAVPPLRVVRTRVTGLGDAAWYRNDQADAERAAFLAELQASGRYVDELMIEER